MTSMTHRRGIAALALAALSLLAFCSSALGLPTRLWRVEVRDADSVRNSGGFRAWGENNDPVQHIRGQSCQTSNLYPAQSPDSALISATEDYDYALGYARHLIARGVLRVTIFELVPDYNFFEMRATLLDMREVRHVPGVTLGDISLAATQFEWFAVRRIDWHLIVRYQVVTSATLPPQPFVANADFQPPATYPNSLPYAGPRNRWWDTRTYLLAAWFMSACFAPTGPDDDPFDYAALRPDERPVLFPAGRGSDFADF